MKFLVLVAAALLLGGCGGSDDPAEEVEESAEEVYETYSDEVSRPLEEAVEVEQLLEDAAAERDRAIEDASR